MTEIEVPGKTLHKLSKPHSIAFIDVDNDYNAGTILQIIKPYKLKGLCATFVNYNFMSLSLMLIDNKLLDLCIHTDIVVSTVSTEEGYEVWTIKV